MHAPGPCFYGENIKGAQPVIKVKDVYDLDILFSFQLMLLHDVSSFLCVQVYLNVRLFTEKILLSESHSMYCR